MQFGGGYIMVNSYHILRKLQCSFYWKPYHISVASKTSQPSWYTQKFKMFIELVYMYYNICFNPRIKNLRRLRKIHFSNLFIMIQTLWWTSYAQPWTRLIHFLTGQVIHQIQWNSILNRLWRTSNNLRRMTRLTLWFPFWWGWDW